MEKKIAATERMTTTNRRRRRSPNRALNSSSSTVEHIGSEIGLPCLNVLPDGATLHPQASLLRCSLNLKVFHLYLSLSLFYLKNESEMKLWMSNETLSLSLFKTLFDSLFLIVIVCYICLALFITLLIFSPIFGFICWCWCLCC